MTDYVKSTNFASKDSLATGNPLKIVKGTEIDTEFNNIATAVATKADLNSPILIGTPVAPTAPAGTNTTQLANTAFVKTAVDNYDSALTVSTSQIEDNAVTTAKLSNNSVTADKLSTDSVTADKIAANAVGSSELSSNAVTTSKIVDANVTPAKLSQPLTLASVQVVSSGTAIDFTSIPSWVKRITVAFWGISTNGSSPVQIQLGAGGFGSTVYVSAAQQSSTITTSTTGVVCTATGSASNNLNGTMVFTLVAALAGNQYWSSSGSLSQSDTGGVASCGARVTVVGGPPDRLRITTVNGTDTFDIGSVNILYE